MKKYLFLLIPGLAFADVNTIYVKSTKLDSRLEDAPYSISVKTAEELQKKSPHSIGEALQDVPGLSVASSGGSGQSTSLFIRGAKTEHTLVMIDGLELNEAMSIGRAFDFSQWTVDSVEQIEVMRGSQSVLYGSDAIGGVVNIITKKGRDREANIFVEAGTYGSNKTNLRLAGSDRDFHYAINASRFSTEGFSSADKNLGNAEEDGFRNTNISLRIGKEIIPNLNLDLSSHLMDNFVENDRRGGAGGDDPNYITKNRIWASQLQSQSFFVKDRWENKNAFAYTKNRRRTVNEPDLNNSDDLHEQYDSELKKFSMQNIVSFANHQSGVLGIEDKVETGKFTSKSNGSLTELVEKTAALDSVYGQYRFHTSAWQINLGMRNDWHDLFGSVQTYQFAPARMFSSGTKLRATVGTGFKAPSLYQLYSGYGNTNLLPEKSISWDAGIEQRLLDGDFKFDITYFQNRFKQLIDYENTTQKYQNIGKARTSGVEFSVTAIPSNHVDTTLQLTWLDSRDEQTGLPLLRRAKQKSSWDLNFHPTAAASISVQELFIGERDDLDPATLARKAMPSYTVTNLWATYILWKELKLRVRVENLWNKEYQNVNGYGAAGLSFYLGCQASL